MKAVVLGGTGGSGEAITRELLARNIETVVVGRNKERLDLFRRRLGSPDLLSTAIGDAFQKEQLIPHFERADVVFHAVNVPYQDMAEKLLRLGEAVMQAAESAGTQIVFVDGIYVYGENPGYPIGETFPHKAHTKKGRLKADLARMVFSDEWRRALPLIVRLPDYYGPTSKMAYLNPTLEGLAHGRPTVFFGNLKVRREYVYLPDAARMIVEIALREDSYGEDWNIPAYGTISGEEILQIARDFTKKRSLVIPIGKKTMQLAGLFDPFCREVIEILYLMDNPVILSGEKYASRIGPIASTPYHEGIRMTLESILKKQQ